MLSTNLISGVYVFETLTHQDRQNLLKFTKWLELEVFSNYDFPEYSNLIYKSDELKTFNQIRIK
jgi:hypothetical protein